MKRLVKSAMVLSVIAVLMVLATFGVGAQTANVEVTSVVGTRNYTVITVDGNTPAYCVQRNVDHPTTGTVYTPIEFETVNLDAVYASIFENNDDTENFRIGAQFAIWATIENKDMSNRVNGYANASAKAYYLDIMEKAEKVDVTQYEITENFYGADGVQIISIFNVKKIEKPVIPEEEPTPDPVIEEEPTPDPDPVVEEEPTPDPVPEKEPEPEIMEEPTPNHIPEEEPEPEVLADEPYYPQAPQTGDNSNIMLWIGLCCISAVGLICVCAIGRKKKEER